MWLRSETYRDLTGVKFFKIHMQTGPIQQVYFWLYMAYLSLVS